MLGGTPDRIQTIESELRQGLKDDKAMHKAQLDFISLYKQDPSAFHNAEYQILLDLKTQGADVNAICGKFELFGIAKPENQIAALDDGKGGFEVKVKDEVFHIDSQGNFTVLPDANTEAANLNEIVKNIELGTPDSIHRAQMEFLDLYKMYGTDSLFQDFAKQVYNKLASDRDNGTYDAGSLTNNLKKFGLMSLANPYGCSPIDGSPGQYAVTQTKDGYNVTWTSADGNTTFNPLHTDDPTNTDGIHRQGMDFYIIDPGTGEIKPRYDLSTVEAALGTTQNWYEAGKELYELKSFLSQDDFNALCKQLEIDAKNSKGKLPVIGLETRNGDVIAVNLPDAHAQIYQLALWAGDPFQIAAHLIQYREASDARAELGI